MKPFKIYLHPTKQGGTLASQRMNCIGDFLGTFSGATGIQGTEGTEF